MLDFRYKYLAVAMTNTVFRDVTAYSPVEVYRRFGGKYGPHL
jgi:hypothetical protein